MAREMVRDPMAPNGFRWVDTGGDNVANNSQSQYGQWDFLRDWANQQMQRPVASGIQGNLIGNQLAGFNAVPGQLQGAMGQIGNVLQGNAARTADARKQAQAYDIAQKQIAADAETAKSRNSLLEKMFGLLGGQGSQGGPFTNTAPSMQAGYQMPGLGQGVADSYQNQQYGSLLGKLGAPASYDATQRGYDFTDQGGQKWGGLTVPNAPWEGGNQTATVQTGINIPKGSVWGAPQAANAAGRLKGLVGSTASGLAGTGAAQQFTDFMQAMAAKNYNLLNRAGTKAEAESQLDTQTADITARNKLLSLMEQMYGTNLKGREAQDLSQLRMLQALSGGSGFGYA